MIVFELPTMITLPLKTKDDKRVSLNLNAYRNLNHFVNNSCKREFRPLKIEIFRAKKIEIEYRVEKATKGKFDTMNIVSIVDKFFLDWLVEHLMIPDDTFRNVEYGKITGINGCRMSKVTAWITILEEWK